MIFRLEIDCENDMFQPDPVPEIRGLLLQTAKRLLPYGAINLHDLNGNTVGRAEWIGEPEPEKTERRNGPVDRRGGVRRTETWGRRGREGLGYRERNGKERRAAR